MREDDREDGCCNEIRAQFREGIRQLRAERFRQWLIENWSQLYDCDDTRLAADANVHRGTVGRWRNGNSEMDLGAVGFCQVLFAARAQEKGIDVVAGALSLRRYDPDLRSLVAAGYAHALSWLAEGRPISPGQFQYLHAMVSSEDWQLAYALGESDEMSRIADRILGRFKGPGPAPRNLEDLLELYRAWRGPWDKVISCINVVTGNL